MVTLTPEDQVYEPPSSSGIKGKLSGSGGSLAHLSWNTSTGAVMHSAVVSPPGSADVVMGGAVAEGGAALPEVAAGVGVADDWRCGAACSAAGEQPAAKVTARLEHPIHSTAARMAGR